MQDDTIVNEQDQQEESPRAVLVLPEDDERARLIERLQVLGERADEWAQGHVFEGYRRGKAKNTMRRRRTDLASFRAYLKEGNIELVAPLETEEGQWQWAYISPGLVAAYREWLINKEYAMNTISARLSSVHVYAEKAFLAKIISHEQYLAIKAVHGPAGKEAERIDEMRREQGKQTRVGDKRATLVNLTYEQLQQLFAVPDTSVPQGWRDLLMLHLLWGLGPRPGEVTTLTLADLDLAEGTIRVLRHKTHQHREEDYQYLIIPADAMSVVRHYLGQRTDHRPEAPLLVRTTNRGELVERVPELDGKTPFWSTRNLSRRVHDLGLQVRDADGQRLNLCAYLARHDWTATVMADPTNTLPEILDAGGWSGDSGVWRRYRGRRQIANKNITLNRKLMRRE